MSIVRTQFRLEFWLVWSNKNEHQSSISYYIIRFIWFESKILSALLFISA